MHIFEILVIIGFLKFQVLNKIKEQCCQMVFNYYSWVVSGSDIRNFAPISGFFGKKTAPILLR